MGKKKVVFKCETITPLFLGEAITGNVELRPPPIKAAMRFWWRAMHSHLSLDEMRSKERNIFGGIEKVDERSAQFDILVSEPDKEQRGYNYSNRDNPAKIEGISWGAITGLQYLFYSLIVLKKKGQYYLPKTKFDVTFYFNSHDNISMEVLASFWLLVFFGNLGQRSRRGVGSFKVLSVEDDKDLCPEFKFNCPSSIHIKEEFDKIVKLFNPTNKSQDNNSFSNLYNADIFISSSNWNTWEEALNNIGTEMKNKRLDNHNHGIISKNEAAYFGLPIKDSKKYMYKPNMFTRRASPLIIKIIEPEENNFKWLLIHLEGDFLPNGMDELNIGGKADPTVFNKFIADLITNQQMTKL